MRTVIEMGCPLLAIVDYNYPELHSRPVTWPYAPVQCEVNQLSQGVC